jgi:hypothetical protein
MINTLKAGEIYFCSWIQMFQSMVFGPVAETSWQETHGEAKQLTSFMADKKGREREEGSGGRERERERE